MKVIANALSLVVIVSAFLHESTKGDEGTRGSSLPNDPKLAWAEVENVHRAMRPPQEWAGKTPTAEQEAAFRKQIQTAAFSFAGKAREFIARFPTNENIGDARITVVHSLVHAVATGDPEAEKQIDAFVASVLADKTIPEDNRVGVLLYAGNARFFKAQGMRVLTEGLSKFQEEFETASIENMRGALRQFPTNSLIFTMLVAVAQRSTGPHQKELATEILNAPGAPPGAKTLAGHLLRGTRPYQLGKPVDIQFAALDGREVDLTKMNGKVVMVEFWSTTCGPCIAGIPAMKALYEKFHKRGFEIIGISVDDRESAVREFVAEKALPWPQHFDGKGWENKFAVRYGVFSLPTIWLIDKRGALRSVDGHQLGRLENVISRMVDEAGPTK